MSACVPGPSHVKTARAGLKWTQKDLADAANVSPEAVQEFESGGNIYHRSYLRMIDALELAGISFVYFNDYHFDTSGLGVALKMKAEK